MELWVNDMVKKMNAAPTPTTITECESQLELHQERKAEIEGRDVAFAELKKQGEELIVNKDSPDASKSLQVLAELHNHLHEAWNVRAKRLRDAHQLQLFKAQTEQVETWLSNKEAFLNNDDIGDSYNAVEKLIKKHEAFQKLLDSDNVGQLEKFAQSILASEPAEAKVISEKLRYILKRKR